MSGSCGPTYHSLLQDMLMLMQLIDPYWTLIPVLIAHFYAWVCLKGEARQGRQSMALALMWLWSVRLTHSYFRRCGVASQAAMPHLLERPSACNSLCMNVHSGLGNGPFPFLCPLIPVVASHSRTYRWARCTLGKWLPRYMCTTYLLRTPCRCQRCSIPAEMDNWHRTELAPCTLVSVSRLLHSNCREGVWS